MLKTHHHHWHEFLLSRPGRRFQDAHARHLADEQRAHGLQRWLLVGLGMLLTLAGIVLLAFPGPGLLVAFCGMGLIAREFLAVARLMDRAELLLRPAFLRVRRWWRGRRRGRARRDEAGL
ncbi:PGPGW domain-containing protein [Brevifollis gellanilyticus]|uniref:TIGR02611 family protein n=1 Tax=Brevifollis gellanilyticus TaxID=748831 RepID=A0A512MHV3_9BACT|nr:PGPGW domain-containing protein [Brevifollis gellanilyticus]GEP46312.1 hypothetical protein BGE01nite_56030 [Brevifollis gellanilyticus]